MLRTLCVILVTLGWIATLRAEEARTTLKLGMSAPFSGPAAALGQELHRGAKAYFDQRNHALPQGAATIELITRDDMYEPVRTIENVRQFMERDRVFALFGVVGTPTSKVAVPIATRAKLPFFGAFTGADILRRPVNPYVLNVRSSYHDETRRIVDYIVDKLGVRDIGMLIQDDAFGSAGRSGVDAAISARRLPDATVAKYQRNTLDVDAAVTTLKARNAPAVVMVGTYAPIAAFIKKSRARGYNPKFFTISFVGTSALIEALATDGRGVIVSQVMPSPEFSGLPIVREYRDAIAKLGNTQLNYGSLEGYVDAKVFDLIAAKAPTPLTAEAFLATAETMGPLDIGGLTVTFGHDDHQGLDNVYLTEIRDGKAIPLDEHEVGLSDNTTQSGDSVPHPAPAKQAR